MQAAQTRQDVLHAATELFATAGWSGTTLAALASRAGVAVETVYAGLGSKKQVLRAVLDASLPVEGDDVPGRRTTKEQRLRAAVAAVAEAHERSAGVWRALLEAASGDGEVEGWRVELERRRRRDVGATLERVFGVAPDPLVVDLVWALLGPDAWLRLVVDAGWSREDYESSVADAVTRLVGPVRRRRSA
jgi:AcrR family transcriptional regulator